MGREEVIDPALPGDFENTWRTREKALCTFDSSLSSLAIVASYSLHFDSAERNESMSSPGHAKVPTRLNNLKVAPKLPTGLSPQKLVDGYQPHKFDVLCGRDKESVYHIGNNRFRLFIDVRVDRYIAATSKSAKTLIVKEIIEVVRASGGRFIISEQDVDWKCSKDEDVTLLANLEEEQARGSKMCPVYYDIGQRKAIDKTGHAIRAAVLARASNKRRKSWPNPFYCLTEANPNVEEGESSSTFSDVMNEAVDDEAVDDEAVPLDGKEQLSCSKTVWLASNKMDTDTASDYQFGGVGLKSTMACESSNRRRSWHAEPTRFDDTNRHESLTSTPSSTSLFLNDDDAGSIMHDWNSACDEPGQRM